MATTSDSSATRSRVLRWSFAALGIALLWFAVRGADPGVLWQRVVLFGAGGMITVTAIYAFEFALDTAAWQLTLEDRGDGRRWFVRLYAVRMVGEAVNALTPLAGFGGEPVKALMLRRHHGIGLGESASSLIAAKTVNMISLVIFLAGAFVLILGDPRLDGLFRALAVVGLVALVAGTALLVLAQRLQWSTAIARRLAAGRLSGTLSRSLERIETFDRRLAAIYRDRAARIWIAIGLALGNWVVGAIGVWVALWLLGTPVGAADAWMIEAVTQLVRAGTFFIPANLGAQEGAFVVVCAALGAGPDAGLAVALVRRARDLLWIAAGVALGSIYRTR